ncbi:MAG: M48 family metallopeptidase [Lentisphaerae bacterium]|nr:M48 family metallopeptidase [Lentisphaerota bacterium]
MRNHSGRRRRVLALAALAALAAVAVVSCVTEPETGRRRLILTSMSQEASLGQQSWTELTQSQPLSRDQAKTAAVQRVGAAISQVVKQSGFAWEFKCFASDEMNAFCLPGGKVGVYEGLFKAFANDAEMAAVVAHEIAHATARHGGERMTYAMAVGLAGLGLNMALDSKASENRELWMAAYAGVTTVGVILPYSRVHEYEADEIGALYMARAGYDPRAAVAFWEKFAAGKSGAAVPEILSTHPVDANRVARLKQVMPRALAEYEKAPQRRGLGVVY